MEHTSTPISAMKRLMILLLALVMVMALAACADGSTAQNAGKDDESGKAMYAVTDVKYTYSDGSVQNLKIEYDDSGRITSQTSGEEGEDGMEIEFQYDSKGFLTSLEYVDEKEAPETAFTWDDDGNMTAWEMKLEYDGEARSQKTVFTYDKDGNVLTQKGYQDDELKATIEYAYEKGVRAKMVEKYEDDWENIVTYDSHGNPVKEERGSDGEISFVYTYENTYDDDGKLVTVEKKSDGETQSKMEYTYDEHGNILTIKSYEDGELYSTQEYTYKKIEPSKKNARMLKQILDMFELYS